MLDVLLLLQLDEMRVRGVCTLRMDSQRGRL